MAGLMPSASDQVRSYDYSTFGHERRRL